MIKIDYSQLSTFINCPRKYFNRYIRKLKKRAYDDRDVAQDWGACFHNARKILYLENNMDKALQYFRNTFVGVPNDLAKTPAHGEQLIRDYWSHWHTYNSELANKNFEVLEVENVIEYPLSDNVVWFAKLDTVIKNNGGIWSLECKTTTDSSNKFFFKFDPNTQISGQCEMIRQKYGQCSGAWIDCVASGYRQRAYKGQSAGFWSQFSRDIINRNPTQLEDFRRNVCSWCAKLETATGLGVFDKNEDFCHSFKGCQYKEICTSCDDQELIDTLYEQHDPFNYLKEETNDKD